MLPEEASPALAELLAGRYLGRCAPHSFSDICYAWRS